MFESLPGVGCRRVGKDMSKLRRAIKGVLTKSTGLVDSVIDQAHGLRIQAEKSPISPALQRAVDDLSADDYALLYEHKTGLTYEEIARKRGLCKQDMLMALARIYAALRMKTMPGEDPPGNDVEVQRDQAA